jgi:AcrR family transcriptional regulator
MATSRTTSRALALPRARGPVVPAPVARRSQQQRSDETRAALLDATIACLHEVGYAGTSTTLVSERAGVSRGAQTHHFPTKTELVVEAVSRLASALVDALDRDLAKAATAPDVLDAFLQGIWRTLDAPVFETGLELMVAARSDPALRGAWLEGANRLSEVIDSHVSAVAAAIRPRDPQRLQVQLHLSVLLVQAFALDGVMRDRRRLHRELFEAWAQQVRAVAFEPEAAGTARPRRVPSGRPRS